MPCKVKGCMWFSEDKILRAIQGLNEQYCILHLPADHRAGEFDKANFNSKNLQLFNESLSEIIAKYNLAGEYLILADVIFPESAELRGATFPKTTFENCKALGDVDFDNSTFTDSFAIEGGTFNGELSAKGSTFEGDVTFKVDSAKSISLSSNNSLSTFSHSLRFLPSAIQHINLDGAMVEKKVDIEVGHIQSLYAANATFVDDVNIQGKQIRHVNFFGAIFLKTFNFQDSSVLDIADFRHAKFESIADFSCPGTKANYDSIITRQIGFDHAVFSGETSFSNRVFSNGVSFKDVVFLVAPKFHDCELHQDTNFEGTKFHDVSADAERQYRTLKLAMENFRARREEGMFYALQQRCLRNNPSIDKWTKLVSAIYDITSGYGQSIKRAFMSILLVCLVIFPLIYSIILSPHFGIDADFNGEIISEAFVFSVEQAVKPFSAWKASGMLDESELKHSLLVFTATVQSILFLSLLAIFLFTVRWRFKRG